jgi:hypothetical protein
MLCDIVQISKITYNRLSNQHRFNQDFQKSIVYDAE